MVSMQGCPSTSDSDSVSSASRSMSSISLGDSSSIVSTTSSHSSHSHSHSHQPSTQATHFPHHYSAKSSTHRPSSADHEEAITSPPDTHPTGTLTLLTPQGIPYAFLSATTLTAFRTALAATQLFLKRTRVHTIVIFGAGAQAYWHLRLALLARGSEIHHVRIINRTFATAGPLLRTIYTSPLWADLRTSNPKLDFTVLTKEFGEYPRLLKEYVRDADAIFCTVPSTEALFPGNYLTNPEGRRKGRYLSMIGSYQKHMCEVSPEVLRAAVDGTSSKAVRSGGAVVVDSLEACLQEAGEIIQAGLQAHQLVELGELIMIKRAQVKEVEMGGEHDKGLMAWLQSGNVVYKSVGIGIMDVSVGAEIVRLAREKHVGVSIDGF